jgi:hypothetical protein
MRVIRKHDDCPDHVIENRREQRLPNADCNRCLVLALAEANQKIDELQARLGRPLGPCAACGAMLGEAHLSSCSEI